MHHPKVTARKGHGLGLMLVLLAVLSLMLFAFTGPAAAVDVLDQQQTSANGGYAQLNGPGTAAQTFTAGHSAPLGKISVYVGGWGAYIVQAEIYSTAGLLGTTQVAVANGAAGWQDITFTPRPTLTVGVQYSIVLRMVDHSFIWCFGVPDPYLGGSASWNAGWDMCFKTYYYIEDTTPPVVTPPANATADALNCLGTVVNFGPASATDDTDGALPASSIHYYSGYGSGSQKELHSGDTFPIGTTTVTAAATDSSGNIGTATFTVTVNDTGVVVPDQQQPTNANAIAVYNWGGPTASALFAQTFTAGRSGPLTKASLYIKNDYYSDGYSAQLLLCKVPLSGEPPAADQILAAASVHFTVMSSTDYWQDFTFTSPAMVTAGTQYALVLVGARFGWWYNSDSSYTAGTGYEGTGGFWYENWYDFEFKTFVEVRDATPPVVTAPGNMTLEATSSLGAKASFAATATDDVDGAMPASAIRYFSGYGTASQAEVQSGDVFPIGVTTVTAAAIDSSGNVGTASFTIAVQDTTAPVTSCDAPSGWQSGDVTVHLSATDAASGAAHSYYTLDGGAQQEGSSVTVSGDGIHPLTFWSVDNAGNIEAAHSAGVKIDTVAPGTAAAFSGATGENGWYTSDVQVTLSGSDSGSGVEETKYSTDGGSSWQTYSAPFTLSEQGTTRVEYYSTDTAGNAESPLSTEVKIDTVVPVVTIATPVAAAVYTLNQPAGCSWSASDATSGVDEATATPADGSPIDTCSVGSHTFIVTVKDNAGNEAQASVTYCVHYAYSGTQRPINADGSSVFRLGSTVPVKFQLTDAGGVIATSAVASISYAKVSDGVTGDQIEAISTAAATSGNAFRYDATAQQYIFNWSTKGLTPGTYQLKITLGDGASYASTVGLK